MLQIAMMETLNINICLIFYCNLITRLTMFYYDDILHRIFQIYLFIFRLHSPEKTPGLHIFSFLTATHSIQRNTRPSHCKYIYCLLYQILQIKHPAYRVNEKCCLK